MMPPIEIIAGELKTDLYSLLYLRDKYYREAHTFADAMDRWCLSACDYLRVSIACQQVVDEFSDYSYERFFCPVI